ncbi:hypothetical protein G5I_00473 [Acromyrmex echinatior]|uniref:SANTA domain-containing protein n=1 Tax=Acromyrmex echinatior TaxID=103372 RepID=F4W4Y6_ACREC|nr:hypothetical protein G5I_00473 [Acromyrmex echinatior]
MVTAYLLRGQHGVFVNFQRTIQEIATGCQNLTLSTSNIWPSFHRGFKPDQNIKFGDLETDERFKKLQRTLKLAVLQNEHSKSVHNRKPSTVITWPSISSINADTLDSSITTPLQQTSLFNSEVLTSSNNLRNIFLKKKSHNIKQEAMTTSSLKQYDVEKDNHVDRLAMPPPMGNTIYRTVRESQNGVCALSNCEKVLPSFDSSICSSTVNTCLKSAPTWISTNTCADRSTVPEYQKTYVSLSSVHNSQNIDRVFSKWKVTLNNYYELIIKGTLDCGKVVRSKPVIRRYSAKCVESKYKHVYILTGNIVDERNGLPDYIRGKFYNGFPDDWENVHQIWRTYAEQGCPVTFRWPTPITDSDDDLKSELTDMTYAHVKNKNTISATKYCNLNKSNKIENMYDISKEKEICNYSTHSIPSCEKNSSFIKPFIYNSEKDIIPVVQIKNTKSLCDEASKQNFNSDINPPCRKVNKLKDILQEDKLNIIINNLADKNCPPKYINKIIEMLDCLDYAVSYRTESECNNDSMISTNHETYKSETISLQKSSVCDDNPVNTNKLQNKSMELKSCTMRHSIDPEYGNIKNNSNTIQLSNSVNLRPELDNNSDKLESEIYAGIRKISIEPVLKSKELPGKIYKRKMRKKTTYPDTQKHVTNLMYNTKETKSSHMAMNEEKKLFSNESCVSITEDEVGTAYNMRKCRQTIPISPRSQEMTYSNRREIEKNFEMYEKDKFVTHVQNKYPINAFDTQRVNSDVFTKEQNIPYRVQNNVHSQLVSDVDYTINSDVNIVTVSSRTADRNVIASPIKMNQNIAISENNEFSEKSNVSSKLRKEFIEQTKNDIVMKKSKPIIISSVPVNLKMRISKENLNTTAEQLPPKIINNDKQNIRPLENINKNFMSIASVVNDSHTKTIDNKREVYPITNNNKLHDINSTNPTTNSITEQSKSSKEQCGVKKNPKMLTAWMPKVVYYAKSKSGLGLTFQGKLVNEAGHVVHRNYTTDIVLKRLSAILIESVNHEFFELLGNLNDNKHIIPKELVKQCRYGCPSKIEQFCLTWKTLQQDNIQEINQKSHDATVDSLNAPVSSRGRHILPPLCYWTGERITLKDNNPVYSPGNSQKSSLHSQTNNLREIQRNIVDTDETNKQNGTSKNTSQKQNVNKQIMPESNTSDINKNQSQDPKKSHKVNAANNAKRSDNSRKSVRRKRRKLMSSTDSSEEKQKASRRKYVRKLKTNKNVNSESRYTMALRKRQNVTCNYYKSISQSEDALSEDEESFV